MREEKRERREDGREREVLKKFGREKRKITSHTGKGVVLKKEYPLVPSIRLTVVPPESRLLSELKTVVSQSDHRVTPLLGADKSVFCWGVGPNSPNLLPEDSAPLPSLADVQSEEEEGDDDDHQHG